MTLLRVAVVRPHRTPAHQWGVFLGAVGMYFLFAWILMLILGAVTPWHLGYWHSLLALIGIKLLQNGLPTVPTWTFPGRKGDAS